jgi:hypothetical protein
LDISGRIILKLIEKGWGGVDSTDLAQDKSQLRVHVNTVMNLQVS